MSYAIKGIQAGRGPNGELPLRREIDEWWFSPDLNDVNQKSLFIYAMTAFQQRGLIDDDLSYMAICGIHAFPLESWPIKNGYFAYCTHDQPTFSNWHAAYLLLFEQRIYEEMRALIPKTFAEEDQDEMIKAADTWRFPFWDWAMKKPTWNADNPDDPVNRVPGVGPNVPFLITQKQVSIRTRTGGVAGVDNPLFQFALPKGLTFGDFGVPLPDDPNYPWPWYVASRVTTRNPVGFDPDMEADKWNKKVSAEDKLAYAEGLTTNWSAITKQLQGPVASQRRGYYANTLPEAVYRLFNSVDPQGDAVMSYEEFATTGFRVGQQTHAYPSLEFIHNNLHNYCGGPGGHMTEHGPSAFDPIFWLHHAQDLYEKQTHKWLDSGLEQSPDGFYGPAAGLSPFTTDDKGTFFDSVACAYKHQEHGYTYPELQKWRFTKDGQFDQEAYKRSIHADIERLYSTTPKAALLLKSNEKVAKAQMAAMTAENLQVENFPPPLVAMASQSAVDKAQTPFQWILDNPWGEPPAATWNSNDYVINVIYERFALEGDTYAINVFLGDVPAHSSIDFSEDLTAISRVYNFSSRAEGRGSLSGCEGCRDKRDANAKSSGQVVLTDYLIEHIVRGEAHKGLTLESLDKDEVVAYLKKNLHWRIVDSRDQTILKENMPSLKISVAMAEGTHYSDASQPSTFSAYTTLWDVTQGRLAGAALGDL